MVKHSRINMTARLYEISNGTIKDGLTEDEYREQFRQRILPEWRELKDEKGHQDPWEINEGTMPCICGQKLSARYFKIFNIHNGNMAIIGSGCVKYVRNHDLQSLTPKELRKIVKQKLEGALNNNNNKLFFNDMNDYTRKIVNLISDDWSLVKTATYLKVYRENPNINAMLIDKLHSKAIDQMKGAKEADAINYNQKQSLLQERDRLKKKNYELNNDNDTLRYENSKLKKLNILQENFFDTTF